MARRIHPNRDEGLSGDPAEVSLANLRALMRKYPQGIEALAVAANRSVPTVTNLAYGITAHPQDRTVAAILQALGLRRPIVPIGTLVPEEVVVEPDWPGNILALRKEKRAKRNRS